MLENWRKNEMTEKFFLVVFKEINTGCKVACDVSMVF